MISSSRVILIPRGIGRSEFARAAYSGGTMTHIYESIHMDCPYLRARGYLHEALEQQPDVQLPVTMQLTAHVPATPVELAKDVHVTFARAADPMNFDEPWKVRWVADRGGIYPTFSGELTVRADEEYGTAILELKGEYAPPLGGAGRFFDAVVGHRIAESTAQSLIAGIAAEMRARYEREEAAKKQTSTQ